MRAVFSRAVFTAASETFNRKNVGRSIDESLRCRRAAHAVHDRPRRRSAAVRHARPRRRHPDLRGGGRRAREPLDLRAQQSELRGTWTQGGQLEDARLASQRPAPKRRNRDLFCYFDNDVKVRAPYDARRLIEMLGLGDGLENAPGQIKGAAA